MHDPQQFADAGREESEIGVLPGYLLFMLALLSLIALSHFVPQDELLATLGRYLEWLVPGQSKAVVAELAHFLEHREVVGWVLLATLLFFSSLAFTVLENAMSVIFFHRIAVRRRHFMVSAVLPYCYILALGWLAQQGVQ